MVTTCTKRIVTKVDFTLPDFYTKSTITIEGVSNIGNPNAGSGKSNFLITANANHTDRFNDNYNNRGGGQSPPTPIVGKTLLNTNTKLLNITTASDTFNNLKNILKIDKGSTTLEPNRLRGGGNAKGLSSSAESRLRSGAELASSYFPNGYSKNSVKIRQHDSEVSPRPRRSFQSDSSSSRYYNKNSDILGSLPAGVVSSNSTNNNNPSNHTGRSNLINNDILRGNERDRIPFNYQQLSEGSNSSNVKRRDYHQQAPSAQTATTNDNGYGRNINLNSGGGGNYRQHNNGSGNGHLRQFGPSSNPGYNNIGHNYNNHSKPYGPRSTISSDGQINHYNGNNNNSNSNYRSLQRGPPPVEDFCSNINEYEYPLRSNSTRYNNKSNSLERERNHNRYSQQANLRQTGRNNNNNNNNNNNGNGNRVYERDRTREQFSVENNNSNNNNNSNRFNLRSQAGSAARGGVDKNNVSLGGNSTTTVLPPPPSSSSINSSASSRGISPNSSIVQVSSTTGGGGGGVGSINQQTTPVATPPPQLTSGRWVPPSLRPQHALTQTERNDSIFRRVRGILNKLTPEKFTELSDELLKLDLNSIVILNGVILLIFDKALDEPKYSSMYAQLCKRLAIEAPSFEKDPTPPICTFLRLLINICRDKFNTRFKRDTADSDSQFNKVHRPYQAATENDADEEERRHLAKQRMLGNVKFIGELNKLDMLAKNVLHQCIEEMLDKKKKRSTTKEEMCEDMECLAQLLKTCGKNLDSEQGKELMNQYFEKLERRSKSTDYPPRIRFMLKDVIELRENNWIPRKVATIEGPVPIKQIRSDDEPLIRTPFVNRNRDMRNNRDDRENNNWMNPFPFNLQSGGFNEYSPCVSATGASTISHFYTSSMGHNRSYGNNNNRERNSQNNNQNNGNHRFNKLHGGQSMSGNGRDDRIQQRDQSNSQYNSNNHMNNNNNNSNKELAPRFKRNLITTHQDPVENLQMRPAANSLLFKVKSNQHQKFPPTLPILTAPTATNSSGNSLNSAGNFNHNNNNNMQLPNTQYPSLNTPITHLTSQPNLRLAGGRFNDNNENQKVNQSSNSTSSSSSSHLIDKTATKFSGMRISPMNQDHQEIMGNLSHNKKPLENGVNEDYGNNNNSMPPPLITKQGSIERASCSGSGGGKQAKKEKSFNKEEVLKKAATFVKDHFFNAVEENSADSGADDDEVQLNELVSGFLELKVPEKCMKDVGINMILDVLEKGDEFYLNRLIIFLQALRKQANLKPNMFFEIFRQVVNKVNEREALNPRITAHLASLLSKATVGEFSLLKLNDIAIFTDNGQYYPLFLLVLQHQHKTIGKAELEAKFYASKIDLMNCLPEVDRIKERLAEILDDRSLTFLYPLLKVQAEMSRQIANDSNPVTFLKWIKTNVESKHYSEEGFINALMTVIVKYVTAMTTLADGVDVKTCPDKSVQAKEESLLCKYCRILQTFLDHKTELQLIAIYALQVFCYNEDFPRGLLLRWFKYMYDFEVIDEEVFMLWKEDIPEKYPGKCTALCQVNKWITWLQEAESEDD